ncbi:hypothetical protein ABE65_017230 [Fictibacillus phosphorivorans]|uniref:Uncharacterized protein n=1 Tax=Fictibacillus phosphorivorans TaxID=1221500 RepID=A0A168W800_9BACL|nr:hypothetical protein ABE65_017230 [Fictibacillus phosphorivorans]
MRLNIIVIIKARPKNRPELAGPNSENPANAKGYKKIKINIRTQKIKRAVLLRGLIKYSVKRIFTIVNPAANDQSCMKLV